MDNLANDVIKWRRQLHQIPELGLDLPKTSQYICDALDEMGIPYKRIVGGNAVVGLIEGAKGGKCIGLRADMDGLPVVEETGLPFASTNGNMHACGHDSHMAMLLGAAKILNDKKDSLKGSVKLLFQPAEETPGGAKPMIEEGALENPKVDAVFGIHAGHLVESLPHGSIAFKHGAMMAAPDIVSIVIEGKGTHAAYPQNGVDVIVIASQLILALQSLVSRKKEATEPAVVSICKFQAGHAHNVLPSRVELLGTVRTLSKELRTYYRDEVTKICRAFEDMHGVNITLDYQFVYPPLINDSALTDVAIDVAKRIFDEKDVITMTEPTMGGEDFAFFAEAVPSVFAFLTNPRAVGGVCYPHHNEKFDIDESHMIKGSQFFVAMTERFLNTTEERQYEI